LFNERKVSLMGFDNPIHILLLLVVVLLVFGAKRLPEIGRSLGDGMRGFKESIHGDVHHAVSLDPPAPPPVQDLQPTPVASEWHDHSVA
jgi:sec-independent protein translocase protein TatA